MRILLLFILTLLSVHALPLITLPKSDINIENFPMQIYIDTNGTQSKVDLNRIAKAPFKTTRSRNSFGYQKAKSVWFRFELFNPHAKDLDLFIYHKEAYLFDKVFFFIRSKAGTKAYYFDKNNVQKRAVKESSPTLPIHIKAGERVTVYILNQSYASIMTNIQILDREHYQKTHLIKNMFYAFLFGVLIAIALYNSFLFLTIRRMEYFFYVIFMAGSISYLLYLSGIPLEFFGLNEEEYKRLIFGVSILQIGLIIFTKLVLETKSRMPKFHIVLNIILFLPSFILILGLFIPINRLLPFQAALAMIAAFTLLFAGLRANRLGIKEARYYLFSIGLYLIFAVIGIFTFYGLLPYTELTRNAFYFASLSEVFLLSLLLSYRIGILRQQAIESERQLNQEIASRNALLKQKVAERTQELEELNNTLEEKIDSAVDEIRQKDEDLLRQSRMAMMGEMLSMIAHQWRQPLATIVSVKNTMEIDIKLGQANDETLLAALEDINTYAQYMSKTIDDFSNFFKPNKKAEAFYLQELIETALLMMKNSFDKANIAVQTDYDECEALVSYKNELLQVFLNILKNAQDALLENHIAKPLVSVSIKNLQETQEIRICDNAGGIDEEILNKIFDPYFSTKEDKNGTGLGLYMSQTIIKEHCQGELIAKNHKNGACFIITLTKSKPKNNP